ncbi:MAG: c-type cytochrome domain-containing protein, partial [Pirellulaceae bacterium]
MTIKIHRFHMCQYVAAVCLVMTGTSSGLAQSTSESIRDEISYSSDIQPIVHNFCVTCHSGKNPEGDFVLTSYEDVRKHIEDGSLLERINDADDPMPPSGQLPQYMRRMFKIWSDTGYVNMSTTQPETDRNPAVDYGEFTPPEITPVDINEHGFDLLENMQGHWVGSMNLMGQDFDWMAFDFRAIAPSHVHGIFEGGTIGNLFTSFFVTNFNAKRTIMARNGGILNGIYRTSYFVLDKVEQREVGGKQESYYRLVDAYGGKDVMWMELTFSEDNIQFNAYTSRFGLY